MNFVFDQCLTIRLYRLDNCDLGNASRHIIRDGITIFWQYRGLSCHVPIYFCHARGWGSRDCGERGAPEISIKHVSVGMRVGGLRFEQPILSVAQQLHFNNSMLVAVDA